MTTATPVEAAPLDRVTEEELEKKARRKALISRWFWRIMGYVVVLGLWEFFSGRVLEEAPLPGPTRVYNTFLISWNQGSGRPAR